jgi:hypothetical protein
MRMIRSSSRIARLRPITSTTAIGSPAIARRSAGVVAYNSTDLKSWNGPQLVFSVPDGIWANPTDGVWAPEVHRYRGKLYLFVTLHNNDKLLDEPVAVTHPIYQGKPATHHLRGAQIFVADSPNGPFQTAEVNCCRSRRTRCRRMCCLIMCSWRRGFEFREEVMARWRRMLLCLSRWRIMRDVWLLKSLERFGYSQTDAAEALRIPLSTLNQKIKRLAIDVKTKASG